MREVRDRLDLFSWVTGIEEVEFEERRRSNSPLGTRLAAHQKANTDIPGRREASCSHCVIVEHSKVKGYVLLFANVGTAKRTNCVCLRIWGQSGVSEDVWSMGDPSLPKGGSWVLGQQVSKDRQRYWVGSQWSCSEGNLGIQLSQSER